MLQSSVSKHAAVCLPRPLPPASKEPVLQPLLNNVALTRPQTLLMWRDSDSKRTFPAEGLLSMSRCNCFSIFSRRACYTPYNIQGLHLLRITQKPSAPISFFLLCRTTQTRNKPKTNKKLKGNQQTPNICSFQCQPETNFF